MRTDYREVIIDNQEYPEFVSFVEKDKILDALLKKAKGKSEVEFRYSDVPDLIISKDQFDLVMEGFDRERLIEKNGTSEFYQLTLNIYSLKEKGGFYGEFEIFKKRIDQLYKDAREDDKNKLKLFFDVINTSFATVSTISDLFDTFRNASIFDRV